MKRCFIDFLLDDVGFNVVVVRGWRCRFVSVREEVNFTDNFAVFIVFLGGAAEVDGESEERKHLIIVGRE